MLCVRPALRLRRALHEKSAHSLRRAYFSSLFRILRPKEGLPMSEKRKDELDAVASATECTGAVPAIPWDGDTEEARKLMKVHRQGKKETRHTHE